MLGAQDIQQLRNEIGLLQRKVGATEYSLSIEYLNDLLRTFDSLQSRIERLEKALKEIATKYVDLNVCSLCGNIWKAVPEMTKIAKKALSEANDLHLYITGGVTLYKMANITDGWKINEIHVSKITDKSWGCLVKLKNGRLGCIVLNYCPSKDEEPIIFKKIISQERIKAVREWVNHLRHLFCCDHD